MDLPVIFRDEWEETLFETTADDFGEPEHRSERRAEFMTDGREEGALGSIGFFGCGSCLARVFEEPCVVERYSDGCGDGGEEALIGFGETSFLIGGLDADDADDLAAGGNWNSEVRSGLPPDLLDAKFGAVAVHIFVDEQRLTCADDLRGES